MTRFKKPLLAATILTLIFALALLLALGFAAPVTAQADSDSPASEETHSHDGMTAIANYADIEGGELNGASYYLDNDIAGNITVKGNVTLCLNGHTITSAENGGSVIIVDEQATFTLCDCVGTGCITGGTGKLNGSKLCGGGVYVSSGGAFYMTGGTICENTADYGAGMYFDYVGTLYMTGGSIERNNAISGGGIFAQNPKIDCFKMSSGSISNNTASGSGGGVYLVGSKFYLSGNGVISGNEAGSNGGGAYATSGTFIMEGGTVSGNNATYGGGVCAGSYGTCRISGGEIIGNTATQDGGGAYNSSTLTISGGTISGNTAAEKGGGVYSSGSKFNLSGAPNITGNHLANDSTNNVSLYEDRRITVAENGLSEGAEIGVFNSGAIATGFTVERQGTDKPSKFFIPDDPSYQCVYVSDATTGDVTIGTHSYVSDHNVESHWTYCTNGCSDKQEEAHTYENGECTVCHIVAPLYWGLDEESGVLTLSSYQTAAANALYESYPSSWLSGAGSITSVTVDRYAYAPENMSQWFMNCAALQTADLHNLDTSRVTDMSFLFSGCAALTSVNVQGIDTSRVTNMSHVFQDCSSLTISTTGAALEGLVLSFNFSTASVTDMSGMFSGCSSIDMLLLQYYPNFTTANVTDMCAMFNGCSGLTSLNVSNFNTAQVTDMSFMFSGCSGLTSLNVSNFDTEQVTDMQAMFQNCSRLTSLDLSSFTTANVENVRYMFNGCSGLTSLNLSTFDTTSVTEDNVSNMMSGCAELDEITTPKAVGTALPLPVQYWDGTALIDEIAHDPENVGNESKTLTRHEEHDWSSEWTTDENRHWHACSICNEKGDLALHTYQHGVCSACDYEAKLYWGLDEESGVFTLSSYQTDAAPHEYSSLNTAWGSSLTKSTIRSVVVDRYAYAPKNISYWFWRCSALETVDLSNLDTSRVTNMSVLFSDCSSLQTLVFPSDFSTAKVTNMGEMFNGCTQLASIDLSSFNTSNVENMGEMFSGCESLTSLDLQSFDTAQVVNMNNMFNGCKILTSLDLSNFNVERVTWENNAAYGTKCFTDIFKDCDALQTIKTPQNIKTNIPLPCNFYNTASEEIISSITSADESTEGEEPVTLVRHEEHDWSSEWTTDENRHWHACNIGCNEKKGEALHSYEQGECTVCGYKAKLYWGIADGVLTLSSDATNPATPNLYSTYTSGGREYPIWSRNDDFEGITSVVVDGYAYAPSSTYQWFSGCLCLETVNLTGLDTSHVTNMSGMFQSCLSLTSVDLSMLDTSNVTTMGAMFYNCMSLTSLNLSTFNTSNVTDMGGMFYNCSSLTSLNLTGFDTAKVTDMGSMFSRCSALTELDLSYFDTASLTDGSFMFSSCNNLNKIITPYAVGSVLLSLPCNFWNGSGDINSITADDQNKTIYRHEWHEEDTAATCEVLAVCSICGQSYGSLAAHTLESVPQQDKTCTEAGVLAHEHCTVCEKDFIDGVEKSEQELVIPAGHTAAEAVRENVVEATCTQAGSYDSVVYCSMCEIELSRESGVVIPELGHDIISHEGKAATCTEVGWNAYETCSRCDYSTYEEIPATGHNISYRAENPATTDTDGNTEHWECEECHKYFADPEGVTEITDKTSVVLPKLPAPAPAKNSALWIALIVILSVVIAAEVALITYREVRKKKAQKK